MARETDALRDESNISTHQRFPAEYVAIETDPVFREVEAALQEDISLQGTGVVCQDEVRGQSSKVMDVKMHPPLSYMNLCFIHIKGALR